MTSQFYNGALRW